MNKSDEERLIVAFGFKADGIKQTFSLETKTKKLAASLKVIFSGGRGAGGGGRAYQQTRNFRIWGLRLCLAVGVMREKGTIVPFK